jgi:holo-[acyl-carrier protein] synthase
MILGFGLDIVSTTRIARILERHGDRFRERVFTPAELEACRERHADAQAEALAARFAAKEACLKALGTGWRRDFAFRNVEVVRGASGAPTITLNGEVAKLAVHRGVRTIHVSLSHEHGMAAAAVILEG